MPRCQMINALCPDDLCVLPWIHKGPHQLGTMDKPTRIKHRAIRRVKYNPLAPYTEDQLIEMGWQLRTKLFPGEDN